MIELKNCLDFIVFICNFNVLIDWLQKMQTDKIKDDDYIISKYIQ